LLPKGAFFGADLFRQFDDHDGVEITALAALTFRQTLPFHIRYPLFQVQPLLRQCYSEASFEVVGLSDLSAADWQSFEATMKPNADQMRMLGHYAVDTRRRSRKKS
jgi:hypothetical protein